MMSHQRSPSFLPIISENLKCKPARLLIELFAQI